MELTLIYRACFLVAFNIISFKGHYFYVLVCYGRYNYPTARFECENIGGRMVTMDTVDIYKDLIFENISPRGKHTQKFWLHKMQGLARYNSSSSCNTAVNKCPYVQMKNKTVLCKESLCDGKFKFLCETEMPLNLRQCVSISTPLMNRSSECFSKEQTTVTISDIFNDTTGVIRLSNEDKNSHKAFALIIAICVGISVMLLLSTVPIILRRRLIRLRRQNQKHSITDEDGYHVIYFDGHSDRKSVQRVSIQSLNYSSMLRIKEEHQEEPTADKNNVYSKFSVQSSVYNKLERSRKASRKKNTSDPDVYSTMNATWTAGLEVKETKDNGDVVVVGESKTPIAKEEDCSNIASCRQNGQYYPIKEVSKVKESDNSALTDDTQIPTAKKSSPESPNVAVSGGCYELAKTFPENDWKIQSCERLDYEMAKNLLMNSNDTKSKSCRTLDYEMARL